MTDLAIFEAAFPYVDDVLALPVKDIDEAANWYAHAFGLTEIERTDTPVRTVLMARNEIHLGFAENGGDPTIDGAAIRVADIHSVRDELEANGVEIANWRIDEQDGKEQQVFFVVAPDGLCYYFHQPLS